MIGAVNIVLFIALSTIGSIIYNLCADIIGGVEVTLSEPELTDRCSASVSGTRDAGARATLRPVGLPIVLAGL